MTVIHDQGYRAYEGERAGIGWSMWSLGIDSARRAFGLKRPAKHKVLPVLVLVIAFLPCVIFVGIAVFASAFGAEDALGYGEYYGFIWPAIVLFSALVAPDVLSTDRRTGMLALYLASPLDRTTYIVSKVLSVFVILLVITLLPLVVLLLGYTLTGFGPDGLGGFLKVLGRILAAGLLGSLFFTGISMAISSFTKRRGIASIAIAGVMLIPTILVNTLLNSGDSVNDNLGLLDIGRLSLFAVVRTLGGSIAEFDPQPGLERLGTGPIVFTALILGLVSMLIVWWQYQKMDVDR